MTDLDSHEKYNFLNFYSVLSSQFKHGCCYIFIVVLCMLFQFMHFTTL